MKVESQISCDSANMHIINEGLMKAQQLLTTVESFHVSDWL